MKLSGDKRNANKGTPRGQQMIQDSLRNYGAGRSILADKDGRVIAGNKTLEAAEGLGLEIQEVHTTGDKLIVVVRDDLDLEQDDKARSLAYADNRIGQVSLDFNVDQILADLNAGFDLGKFWEPAEMDALLAGLDALSGNGTGVTTPEIARRTLADRFLIPPFSVLDARQGYWQERKRAWIALGIQSELGRGEPLAEGSSLGAIPPNERDNMSRSGSYSNRANASPGGSPQDAATLGADGHTVRGDGHGRRIKGKLPADNGGQPLPLDRMKNGKSPARKFAQDLMKGEHVVGDSRHAADRRSNIQCSSPLPSWATETGTTNMATGTSIFDPVLCEIAYRWFCPPAAQVLDPFAGGSVRGIVAATLGHTYTGLDLRAEQVAANEQQATVIMPTNIPKWITGDSRTIKDTAPGEYDFIFSCPPYFDLEIYSEDQQDLSNAGDYATFLVDYRTIIAQVVAMLKDNRFACFVVGDIRDKKGFYRNFPSDTIAAFQDAGMTLYNEAILVTAVGSLPIRIGRQFGSYRKLGKTHQNVLIFYKGNIAVIKEFGDVEVGDPASMFGEVS